MQYNDYELVSARDDVDDWQTYHGIRYRELFVAKGRGDIYDPARPEEKAPNNFPLLLKYKGQGIGTTRLDFRDDGKVVIRLVAVPKSEQGQGHGRELAKRVEEFARQKGVQKLYVNADPNAVGYYEKLSYALDPWDPSELTGISSNSIQMSKVLAN